MTKNVHCAFEQRLKELAVDEFPVGEGSWRNNLKWNSDLLDVEDGVIGSAQRFTNEGLKDINRMTPFLKDTRWGPNAFHIQELMIEENERKYVKKNIHKYFKKLRLVDEGITHLDKSLLQFRNLDELVLSANLIETVDIDCLPQKLKSLELCGNNISNVSTFYNKSLPLNHLGLSHNKIEGLSKPPTAVFWNSLLSLDLSCNLLFDLKKTINVLVLIPKLKSLLLLGNPFYCAMGYHGFVIDSFPSLTLLDDHRISADERYHFSGFAQQQNLDLDNVNVIIRLDQLKDLPCSVETETSAEYPKSSTNYHVEFDFIGDYKDTEDEKLEQPDNNIANTGNGDSKTHIDSKGECVVKSNEISWNGNEEPVICCRKSATSDNLKMFHGYCKRKVVLRLVENKILVSTEPKPIEAEGKDVSNTTSASTTKEKTKSNGKGGAKTSAVKDGKPKGKPALKKDTELFEWSRSSKVIASHDVDIESLLYDVGAVDCMCTFENIIVDVVPLTQSNAPVENIPKKDTTEANKKSRDGGRSKTKPKQEVEEVPDVSEVVSEPKYPSLQFHMEVLRWKSTREAADYFLLQ